MLEIGRIVSVHGVKGELCISHNIISPLPKDGFEVLLLELLPESYIPFFVEKLRIVGSSEWICKFEEVNTREEAKALLRKNVYLSEGNGIEIAGNEWKQYIDFSIEGVQEGYIGKITDIEYIGSQALAVLNYSQHQVQIPLHNDLIEEINTKNRTIIMNLPHGILDL